MATELKVPVGFCGICAAKPKILRTPHIIRDRMALATYANPLEKYGDVRSLAILRQDSQSPTVKKYTFFRDF